MRRAWLVVVVLAVAGLAGPAHAQSSSGVLVAVGAGKVLSETNIPIRVTGQLVVSFHGDASAGCAAHGLCAYSGTIFVRPTEGAMTLSTVRRGKRTVHEAAVVFGTGRAGNTTSSRVQRAGPRGQDGTCADSQESLLGLSRAPVHEGAVTVRVLQRGGSMLQTRCAGPLDGDLAAVSPVVTISLARAGRGRTTLDLSGTRTFAAHGFAGTIDSTLALKLGKPSSQRPSGPTFPPGIRTHAIHIVTERLSAVRVAGEVSAAIRGTTDPVICSLLDTCGLSGTLTLGQSIQRFSAVVIAMGPATRPDRDFRTALELQRGGRSRGISVLVVVTVLGRVRAQINQAGVTCTDAGGVGTASVTIGISGRAQGGAFAGPWRTRCPGPLVNITSPGVVASVRPGALAHRQFTVRLGASGSFTDDGYVLSPRGEVSALVRRGLITSQVITVPGS